MLYSILVTPPADEPISLEEAKAQCRVRHSAEDQLIEDAIRAARGYAESYLERSLMPQTRRAHLDCFPGYGCGITLPRPPIIEVTEIAYTDAAGSPAQLADFYVDANPVDTTVWPLYGEHWPDARRMRGGVSITYQAGYADASLIPTEVRHAILMATEHFYSIRGPVNVGNIVTEVPMSVRDLLDLHRVRVAA